MTDPVDLLLSRLDRVSGKEGRWIAKCPAHDDRSPSLSIGVGDDGRVLIHCFAGCSPVSIVNAVGLELSQLYHQDPRYYEARRHERRVRPDYRGLLFFLLRKMYVLSIAAKKLEEGKPFTDDEWATLHEVTMHLERVKHVR